MREILDALLNVLDEEHAIGLMEHRKAKKAPLTALAAKILLKQLRLCPDPNEAVEEMINRNWTGLKAEWIKGQAIALPNAIQPNRQPTMADYTRELLDNIDARANSH